MKSYLLKRLLLAALLLHTTMIVALAVNDVNPVGTPEGAFSVSPMGGATYSIKIDVPSVNSGLVPSLAISYNSQSGNGIAGWGCNIAGISAISRSLKDYYHDQEARGISYTPSDALYLDGKRLILESGTAGTAGAIYRIEGDPLSTVTVNGNSNGVSFLVHTLDGLDYEYGTGADTHQDFYSSSQQSYVTNAWYLKRVSNAMGDYMSFTYSKTNYVNYLTSVSYGGIASTKTALVTFTYESRSDVQDFWLDNTKGTVNQRLKSITSKVGIETYRTYELAYNTSSDASGVKFSRLTTVIEKNGNGESLKPITLNWNYLPGTTQSVDTPSVNVTTQDTSSFTSFDINGDGIDDIIHSYADDGKYYVNVFRSMKNGNTVTYTSATCEFNGGFYMDEHLYSSVYGPGRVDFDGDGLGDILVTKSTPMSNINYTGFSFGYVYGRQLKSSASASPLYMDQINIPNTSEAPLCVFADFNNDGKTEVFCMAQQGNQGIYRILYYYHIGNNGFLASMQSFAITENPKQLFSGDFNGDGMQDLIVFYDNGYKIYWNQGGTDSTFPFSDSLCTTGTSIGSADHVYQGDFNGDGRPDFILNDENDSKYYFALGNGNGTFQKVEACDLDVMDQSTNKDDDRFTFLVYDINHDGKSDLVLVKSNYRHHGFPSFKNVYSSTDVRWLVSTGTALQTFRSLNYVGDEDEARAWNLLLGDFTGNGDVELLNYGHDLYTNGTSVSSTATTMSAGSLRKFVDDTVAEDDSNDEQVASGRMYATTVSDDTLGVQSERNSLAATASSSSAGFHLYHCTEMTASSGKVTSATDGLGNSISITYKPLTDTGVYTRGTGSSYPVADITVPLHVVSSTTNGNGAAGNYNESYTYGGLKVHNRGRGLMGFTRTGTSNTTLGRSSTTQVEWDGTWFVPNRTITTSHAGSLTSGSEVSLSITSKQNGKNYLVLPSVRTDTDWYGNAVTTTYNYDADNGCLLSERTEWSPQMYRQTSYNGYAQYGGRWLPASVTVTQKHADDAQPFNKATSFTYNSFGQQTSVCEFSGTSLALTKEYGYDGQHRLTSETVSGSGVDELTTHYVYNTYGQVARKYTSPSSADISFTYDTWGNVLTETDNTNASSPLTTTNEYDGWDRLKKSTSPLGLVTNITRTRWLYPSMCYYVREETTGSPWKQTWYDAKGRIVDEYTVGETGVDIHESYNYASNGQTSSATTTKGNLSVTVSYEYDALGRKTSETSSSGSSTTYSYADKSVTSLVSTLQGNCTYEKTFDDWGNVVTSTDPVNSVTYTYGSNGKPLSTVTGDGAEVTMTYDETGNQLSLSDPDAGTTTYEYDALGRVTRQTDARGKVTENTYDALGRIVLATIDGEQTTYTYGTSGNGVMQLTSMSNGNATLSYSYDQYGRVTQESRSLSGENDIILRFYYNDKGQLMAKTYPINSSGIFNYDNNGYLNVYLIDGTSLWSQVSETGQTTTGRVLNSLDMTESRDNRGYLTSLSLDGNNGNVHHMTFAYDIKSGNLMERTGMKTTTELFLYDPMDRLMGVKENNMLVQATAIAPNGNILHKIGVGEYAYNTQKPHAVVSVENDMGNVSTDAQSVEYNAFGKVCHIEDGDYEMIFVYGPDQERWKSVLLHDGDTVRVTLYAGDYEQVTEGDTVRQFVYGENNTLCVKEQGGQNQYYYMFTDHLGSIIKIVDNSGTSVFEASYDAWGVQTVTKNDIGFHRGYTGHEMMPEFGLINMNGRLYDPLLGRFLSPDNYVQIPGYSQSFNRYSYCLNNPLKFTDPSGELFGIDDAFLIFTLASSAMMGATKAGIEGSNMLVGALRGAASAALTTIGTAGIGQMFGHSGGSFLTEFMRAGAHGINNGLASLVDGNGFDTGFFIGSVASLAGSGAQALHFGNVGVLASTTGAGALTSYFVGGSILDGAMAGYGIGAFNHISFQDDRIYNGGTLKEVSVFGNKKNPNFVYFSSEYVNVTFSPNANRKINALLFSYVNKVLKQASQIGIHSVNISSTSNHPTNANRSAHSVKNGARALDINYVNGEHVSLYNSYAKSFQEIIRGTPGYLENYGPFIIDKCHNGHVISAPWARKFPGGHYDHIHISVPK